MKENHSVQIKTLTISLTVALSLSSIHVVAQGTLIFANFGGGVDAPVTNWDGTKLAGYYFMADLWWAPGIVTDSTLLVGVGEPAVFSGNGYFLGGTRTIPGTVGGTIITVQVRTWANAPECVWDCDSPHFQHGQSTLIQVTLTPAPYPPVSLTGLAPFGISPPTTRSSPRFTVGQSGSYELLFSWSPSSAGTKFFLQQNADLNTTNWITIREAPTFVAPQFQLAIPKPTGTMFYRLVQ